jgi:hypothetical protein
MIIILFPSPCPSPLRGEGGGEGARINVRRKFSDFRSKTLRDYFQKIRCFPL